MHPAPPDELFDRCVEDPAALDVLTDWYEEQGQRQWARWLRSDSTGERRKRLLERCLKKSGLRLREFEYAYFDLQEPFVRPLLGTLSWTVRDPGKLDELLGIPPFARAHRMHIDGWRPRTAVPRAIALLQERRPHLDHLDVLDVPLDLESVAGFDRLQGLALRLGGPAAGELAVKSLCIRVRVPADLLSWIDVQTPQLERLEIRMNRTQFPWDPTMLSEEDLEAVLDRPFESLAVDRRLYGAYRDIFDLCSSTRVTRLPPRRLWNDPPPERWTVMA